MLIYAKIFYIFYTQRQWKVTSIVIPIFWKIYNTALWLLLRSCFWSKSNWFWEIKQFHKPWNYGARHARAFYVFRSFKEFEIIVFRRQRARTYPRHCHWKRHQNGLGYPIKHQKLRSNFKVAQKLRIFLYNTMGTVGVRRGMSILHSVWWIPRSIVLMHGTLCHKIECWSIRSSSCRMN